MREQEPVPRVPEPVSQGDPGKKEKTKHLNGRQMLGHVSLDAAWRRRKSGVCLLNAFSSGYLFFSFVQCQVFL